MIADSPAAERRSEMLRGEREGRGNVTEKVGICQPFLLPLSQENF